MKTLKKIAEELGVSVAAVSYVYNDRWKEKGISVSLAEKIKKKLKEENYRPNSLGLQLKTKKTQTIGIVLEDMTRRFNVEILAGIESVLSTKGYFTLVCSSNLGEKEAEILEILSERNVDGIILAPESEKDTTAEVIKKLLKEGLPVILVDNYIPEIKTDFIVSDNYRGAYEAVKYLISIGKRKIAYIGSDKKIVALRDRYKGFAYALQEYGIELDEKLVWKGNLEKNAEASLRYIFSKGLPDAIFVESLMYFKKGLEFLSENNYRIPEDIFITGFDPVEIDITDMQETGMIPLINEPIPFVEQQGIKMGEIAAEIMLRKIQRKQETTSQIFLPPKLMFFRKEEQVGEKL